MEGISTDFVDESVIIAGSVLACVAPWIFSVFAGAAVCDVAKAVAVETEITVVSAVAVAAGTTVAVAAESAVMAAGAEAEKIEVVEALLGMARFFFLPASFFRAASAIAWGSLGGGFCPAKPAAT